MNKIIVISNRTEKSEYKIQEQHCAKELSGVMEKFNVCTVQYSEIYDDGDVVNVSFQYCNN